MAFEHRGWAVGRIGLPSLLAGVAILLALAAPPAQATFPGANGKIAFAASNASGNYDIYTVNPDGTGRTNLTNSPEHETFPAWSADGKRIVFAKAPPESTFGGGYLWTMNADGSGKTQLGSGIWGWHSAWSPDGQKIAAGEGWIELYTINSDGSGYATVMAMDGSEGAAGVDWSPDGQRIAFTTEAVPDDGLYSDHIATIRPDGSDYTDPSPDPLHNDDSLFPSWSPDGQKIAYHWRSYAPNGIWGIYTVNPDGTGNTLIKDTGAVGGLAWSPDKTKIVYAQGGSLVTINSNGSGAAVVMPGGITGAGSPDWQPLRPPGYARPQSATPTSIRLVPAYEPCTSSNSIHGAPLVASSCNPPTQVSDHLTVGTSDANGKAANSTGFLKLKVLTESPIDLTNGDQSDVAFTGQITDVRDKQTLADYTGELRASFGLRLTDRLNGAGAVHPATVADTSFGFSFSCAATAEPPDIGSTCSVATTADAVMPGVTPEAKRAIWELGRVEFYDGGADGDGDTTGDNTLFAVQGLFAP